MSYQTVIIVGHLGRDPEYSTLDNGKVVCQFSVACNQNAKGSPPIWFQVKAWGKLAETCQAYLQKGKQVLIQGSLIADETGGPKVWVKKGNTPVANFQINADSVRFLSPQAEAPIKERELNVEIGF